MGWVKSYPRDAFSYTPGTLQQNSQLMFALDEENLMPRMHYCGTLSTFALGKAWKVPTGVDRRGKVSTGVELCRHTWEGIDRHRQAPKGVRRRRQGSKYVYKPTNRFGGDGPLSLCDGT